MSEIDVGEKALASYVALRIDDWRPVRLSRLKRANVPYIANDVEHQLATAPGAPKPKPKPKPRRASKLEQLDAEIKRCGWCGNWTTQQHVCQACRTNGYPIIHDYERPA